MPNPNIENSVLPSCRNCIHFRPSFYSTDIYSGKCAIFGKKDIITGETMYKNAEMCRNNESACGHIGKYYVTDHTADLKLFMYSVVQNAPMTIVVGLVVLSTISASIVNKP